jgi:hypothetical protein
LSWWDNWSWELYQLLQSERPRTSQAQRRSKIKGQTRFLTFSSPTNSLQERHKQVRVMMTFW